MLIANWSRETSNYFIVHNTIRQDITDLVFIFWHQRQINRAIWESRRLVVTDTVQRP